MDPVSISDALSLRLAVAAGERNVDDAADMSDKLSAILELRKPLGIGLPLHIQR